MNIECQMNKYDSELNIRNKKIGTNHPTYFIADIAANHDGDLNRAIDLIYKAKESGADAAKFQHFNANTIVSDFGFKKLGDQFSHQAKWKKSVYEVYRDASVSLDWTQSLKEACDRADICFFTSPYSFDLVDFIDPFVPAYKIGSGDITWVDMIKYIASKGKPTILAAGASNIDDVHRAVNAALAVTSKFALLQCNTNYTGSPENFKFIQLRVLSSIQSMYPGMVLGLSDHTPGHTTVLGAVTLGARIIEKHFTDDLTREGPDHAFSMNPNEWKEMVLRTRELELALGNGVKKVEQNEIQTCVLQRRAIRLVRDVSLGETLTNKHLEMLRPCPDDALPPYRLAEVIDKKMLKNKSKGDYINLSDVE
jgi:N-acetylneuraminate synthase